MEFKLVVTAEAKNDIRKIVDYITNILLNPTAAINFVDKYESVLTNLTQNPHMYQMFKDKALKSKNYRKVVINNYILVYKIDKNTVYVLRVVYGKRDYRNWNL